MISLCLGCAEAIVGLISIVIIALPPRRKA